MCKANLTSRLLQETGQSQNNKPCRTENKHNGSKSTNHESQTMTF